MTINTVTTWKCDHCGHEIKIKGSGNPPTCGMCNEGVTVTKIDVSEWLPVRNRGLEKAIEAVNKNKESK